MEKQVRWFIWIFKLYDVELPLFFCDKSHVKNWITNQTKKKKTTQESEVTMKMKMNRYLFEGKKDLHRWLRKANIFRKIHNKKKIVNIPFFINSFKYKLIEVSGVDGCSYSISFNHSFHADPSFGSVAGFGYRSAPSEWSRHWTKFRLKFLRHQKVKKYNQTMRWHLKRFIYENVINYFLKWFS